jgi:alpha-L-fucosidase
MPSRKCPPIRSFVAQPLEGRVLLSSNPLPPPLPSNAPGTIDVQPLDTAAQQVSDPTLSPLDDPATSPRTQWWRDAQFGMFIHWGLYSQLAGHWNGQTTTGFGEWIMNDLHIPLDQYAQVANQFNPTQFNAQQWVQIAESAGMKYIVMTAKHHDGFSMFDTSVNHYNVVDATPWHQDPIAQVSAAAHAAGLHFGAYYSILNWADPNASAAGINTYMVTMETQLKELIQNDHVDLLWFDGEWPDWWTDQRGQELTAYLRNLDPAIIINNRVGKRLVTDGDYDTP